jgi:hypothetical protein
VWWRDIWGQHRSEAKVLADEPKMTKTQQQLANRVYATVRRRTPGHALTRGLAFRLVHEHGETTIERALDLLSERSNVYNAAGFLLTVLGRRSSQSQPPVAEESHADWVEKLRQSPYAAFYEIQ